MQQIKTMEEKLNKFTKDKKRETEEKTKTKALTENRKEQVQA